MLEGCYTASATETCVIQSTICDH